MMLEDDRDPEPPSAASPDGLVAVAYRSEPTEALTDDELARLLLRSRQRNLERGISGLLVVAGAQLIQWLEGPEDAVHAVMADILEDPRHRHVSILEKRPIARRLFGPWTMLLAAGRDRPGLADTGQVADPEQLLEALGGSAGSVFPAFESASNGFAGDGSLRHGEPHREDTQPEMSPPERMRAALRGLDVRLGAELKAKVQRRNQENWTLASSALTTLLLEGEFPAVEHFVRAICRREIDPLALQIRLFEQSERRLGDMCRDDRCSETDVVLALTDMVRALRSMNEQVIPNARASRRQPPVLVVTAPGESHMLPAVLDAEVLWQRGWSPHLDFPNVIEELEELVANSWYGAVDIALSGVFRRRSLLRRLEETIDRARRASLNKSIAITIGGRAVYEDRSVLSILGADALVPTASAIEESIIEAISRREKMMAAQAAALAVRSSPGASALPGSLHR